MRRTLLWVVGVGACLWAGRSEARDPSADLKRQIDAGRAAIVDLERLDDKRAVPDETALLRSWYDEAANFMPKEEFDRVREVLDRCTAQSELIRQKIGAASALAQANEREATLRSLRQKIEQTRRDLQQAQVKKQAMEMNAK